MFVWLMRCATEFHKHSCHHSYWGACHQVGRKASRSIPTSKVQAQEGAWTKDLDRHGEFSVKFVQFSSLLKFFVLFIALSNLPNLAGASRTTFTAATSTPFSSSKTHCQGDDLNGVRSTTWHDLTNPFITVVLFLLSKFSFNMFQLSRSVHPFTALNHIEPVLWLFDFIHLARTKRIGRFHRASPTGRMQR